MRTLRIDFTAENMLPDGDLAGRMGEHNATDLIITPPAEMMQCDDIVNYVAAFVTEGKIIRTDFYPKAEQITVSLCSQLTQDHSLSLQLEAYDGLGGLVVKSPVISELKFLPSAGGDETDFDAESGGIVSQINLNTLARHSHKNPDVLDKIGEAGGSLTFDGDVVGGGTLNTDTAEFFNDDSTVFFWYEDSRVFTSGQNIYQCKFIYGCFYDDVPEMPEGTKIAKVEIKTEKDGGYISLDSLCIEDINFPVIKMTNEICSAGIYRNVFFSGYCVFGYSGTRWEDIIDNINWYSLRITYYKN